MHAAQMRLSQPLQGEGGGGGEVSAANQNDIMCIWKEVSIYIFKNLSSFVFTG